MKNTTVICIIAAFGFAHAQAALVDGDFSSGNLKIINNINGENDTDKWAASKNATEISFTNAAEVLTRDFSVKPGIPRGAGQMFGDTLKAGEYVLEFDYSYAYGAANSDFAVAVAEVYLFDDPDGHGDLTTKDQLHLSLADMSYSSLTFDVSRLATTNLPSGTVTDCRVVFTLPVDMVHDDSIGGTNAVGGEYVESDWLAVRFHTDKGASDSAFTIDNVSISTNAPILSNYDVWSNTYALVEGPDGDDDTDGLINLHEYGLGGDPTNNLDQGTSPAFVVDAGTLTYIHPQLSDPDSGLLYYLELNTDLVLGDWTNTGYSVTGTNVTGFALDSVTNTTDAVDNQQFLRLIIELL